VSGTAKNDVHASSRNSNQVKECLKKIQGYISEHIKDQESEKYKKVKEKLETLQMLIEYSPSKHKDVLKNYRDLLRATKDCSDAMLVDFIQQLGFALVGAGVVAGMAIVGGAGLPVVVGCSIVGSGVGFFGGGIISSSPLTSTEEKADNGLLLEIKDLGNLLHRIRPVAE
jgi:hypothetical protein